MKKLRSLVETTKDPRTDLKLLQEELNHAVAVFSETLSAECTVE